MYPKLLLNIPDPPAQLYYKGTWQQSLFENCLAVVGTRHMTTYGKRATEQLVAEIAQAGVTIVSGFMYGIDAMAHKVAVESGGKTIAVMPCGIERVHPEYQEDLYERILSLCGRSPEGGETGGLILSEWEGDAMPAFWTYPKRNRIVAGLCKAVLVVEAGLRSGSLITAELAKKFGRKVFAVPGPITSEVSKGTAKLLKEGALIASCADDILEYYDKKGLFAQRVNQLTGSDPFEQKILATLQREALDADVLARTLNIPTAQLGSVLSLLELKGIIKQEGGKYYISDSTQTK